MGTVVEGGERKGGAHPSLSSILLSTDPVDNNINGPLEQSSSLAVVGLSDVEGGGEVGGERTVVGPGESIGERAVVGGGVVAVVEGGS